MSIFSDPTRLAKRAGIVTVVVLVLIQFVPVARTNPPVGQEVPASAAVLSVLRRSCYDCHSNNTVWPWYSHVAPVSWLVARDVREGRRHVNFSTWDSRTPAQQAHAVREIGEQVEKGEMPMSIYLPLHPDARLSARDKQVLIDWAKSVGPEPPRAGGQGRGGREGDEN